jgi:hypothetical protein
METALQQAARSVGTACAINTTFVKVLSINPFAISPDNLFFLTFKSIGIISDAALSSFLQTLSTLLPPELSQDINGLDLAPDVVIGLVVNHVEALLLKLEGGGFA